ncbi:hypothetical protein J2T09_000914 [Neorhizobium huautlense]|uniref:Uncharacterized protein n=1 Tax=Neorhizobium huautlense TaxID=67774 RepID=A0ABT9PNX9_9HYPH|nr:hypothetical protein [Neorhizobium huautlense]MDP9836172.1 hypothetical protein [Neorhizobium huautlense]
MELDELFGAAVPPQAHGLRPGESILPPQSLTLIGGEALSAGSLAFMLAVQRGCNASAFLSESTTLLWIIDKEGTLRIAIEEAFDINQDERRIPFINQLKATLLQDGWNKLGHPALLDSDKLGRIGGEVVYLPDDYVWEINNLSGRYGLGLDRCEQHLENAAFLLREYGLDVIVDFNQLRT